MKIIILEPENISFQKNVVQKTLQNKCKRTKNIIKTHQINKNSNFSPLLLFLSNKLYSARAKLGLIYFRQRVCAILRMTASLDFLLASCASSAMHF